MDGCLEQLPYLYTHANPNKNPKPSPAHHHPPFPPQLNRFFAPEIGALFFPPANASARAVRTFTVFAGGFLMRPIGSVLLGAIGDRYGTAAALKWSILLMTVPTVATGCLPTYKTVGMAAPFLLTACRLLQGLSGACVRILFFICVFRG